MTDAATRQAYETGAVGFAQDWADQPPPHDMQDWLRRWFRPGPCADIGCGSGRDAAWLAAHIGPTTGYDASPALLAEAASRHPAIAFHPASLPALDGVPRAGFANVLCETVIMHLPAAAIPPSVRALAALLAPGGTLYLSWRITPGEDLRDGHGRLYAAFPPALVHDALAGLDLLAEEEAVSASSNRLIRRIVARKPD